MGYLEHDMNELFSEIYMGIRLHGTPVELRHDTEERMKLLKFCYEYEAMVALKTVDGWHDLGVLHNGTIMTGMFPRMSADYELESIPPERIEYFSKNLEFYQARLKL